MEDKQFTPVSPVELPTDPAPSDLQINTLPTSDQDVTSEAAQTSKSIIAQLNPFTKRLESAKKLRKASFTLTLIGFGATTILFVYGMISHDSSVVQTMQSLVGFAGILVAVVAGLWFAQSARVAVNSYQEGAAELDENQHARAAWFKRLKVIVFIILGEIVAGILGSILGKNVFYGGDSSFAPRVLSLAGRGPIQLAVLLAFIMGIVAVVKLSKSRAKVLTRPPRTHVVHWFLRLLICAVAFLSATGPVVIIVGFMSLQLFSHWCELTNSKCY